MTEIRVYRDSHANAIFFGHGIIGTWPYNCLRAVGNGDETIDIQNTAKIYPNDIPFYEIQKQHFDSFIDDAGSTYGSTETETVNALNAMFTTDGLISAPDITSATGIALVEGQTINYELTSNYGVGYEWEGLPRTITTVEGNIRKLIGGSGLSAGTYGFTATAINYYGQDSQHIVLGVTAAGVTYADTKSVNFDNFKYLDASANTSNPLYRPSNGSGSSDAWSISFWFKPGTHNSRTQPILSFGGNHAVTINFEGKDNFISLIYGSDDNQLVLETDDSSAPHGIWAHWLITYDGGTTGALSGQINDYYSRFSFYKNGVAVSTTNSHTNNGTEQSIPSDLFYIGRRVTAQKYMRNQCRVDEFAIFNSELSAAAAVTLYNSGIPFDLTTMSPSPYHWWRMGDGDTYPIIQDITRSIDFTMLNMTIGDIVTDTP